MQQLHVVFAGRTDRVFLPTVRVFQMFRLRIEQCHQYIGHFLIIIHGGWLKGAPIMVTDYDYQNPQFYIYIGIYIYIWSRVPCSCPPHPPPNGMGPQVAPPASYWQHF